jgi:hypothetical protein
MRAGEVLFGHGVDRRRGRGRMAVVFAAFVVATMVTSTPASADAPDGARARELFDRARRHIAAGECSLAIPLLEESLRFDVGVGPLLNLGDCLARAGKTASAQQYFRRAEVLAKERGDSRAEEATNRVRSLEGTLSTIVIDVPVARRAPGLVIELDGDAVPQSRWGVSMPVDPGAHVLEASAPGRGRMRQIVDVRANGGRSTWMMPELVMVAPATPFRSEPASTTPEDVSSSSSFQRTAGILGLGTGGALVVTGVALAIVGNMKRTEIGESCHGYGGCQTPTKAEFDDQVSKNDEVRALGVASVTTLVSGAILGGLGAFLYFNTPKPALRVTRTTQRVAR